MSKHFSSHQHNVWLPYHLALGPVFKRWFDGLREGKIWGNRCPKCHKTLVPPRSFCPECRVDMTDWIEVSQEGEIVTWTVANKLFFGAPSEPPFTCALVHLDGTDCNLLHMVGGVNGPDQGGTTRKIERGCRVRAVWNEERKGHLLDIKYFQPLG